MEKSGPFKLKQLWYFWGLSLLFRGDMCTPRVLCFIIFLIIILSGVCREKQSVCYIITLKPAVGGTSRST